MRKAAVKIVFAAGPRRALGVILLHLALEAELHVVTAPVLRRPDVEGESIRVFVPPPFGRPDIVHIGHVEAGEDVLLHLADQRLRNPERRLIEGRMRALLGPTSEAGLRRDDHRRADGDNIAETDGCLRAVVAFQRAHPALADVPRRGRPRKTLVRRPAPEYAVALEILVNTHGVVFAVIRRGNFGEVVVGVRIQIAGQVRGRIAGDHIARDGIQPVCRDPAIGKEHPRSGSGGSKWVGNLERHARYIQCLREIAGALQRRRRRESIRPRCALAEPFEVEKPEEFVLHNRSAGGESVLIKTEDGAFGASPVGEEGIGVQLIVAEELVDVPMKRVRSALGHDIDVHAAAVAILSIQRIGRDGELLDVIDARNVRHAIGDVVRNAIQQELIRPVVGAGC